jgi:hypothetical protein
MENNYRKDEPKTFKASRCVRALILKSRMGVDAKRAFHPLIVRFVASSGSSSISIKIE